MKTKHWIAFAAVTMVAAFAAGRFTVRHRAADTATPAATAAKAEFWTCAMHPQIRQPDPGRCPICAMNLVPVFKDSQGLGPRQVRLSSNAVALAGIRTTPVVRRMPTAEVRMVA